MQFQNSSKAAEILARYRPIAPRPQADHPFTNPGPTENMYNNSYSETMPENISEYSTYLRGHVWPQVETSAGPSRIRRRARTSQAPPLPHSRSRSNLHLSPFQQLSHSSPSLSLSLSPASAANVPVERDFLQQLQAPPTTTIKPKAMHLVSSTISVLPYSVVSNPATAIAQVPRRRAVDIEKEVEYFQTLPIVISDFNNKIKFANSAYNKLVGQLECIWTMDGACGGGLCNGVCGDVELQIPEFAGSQIRASNGFFFSVVIEWGNRENNSIRCSIRTSGETVRLFSDSKGYMFAWRFHTQGLAHTPAASRF